MSDQQKLYFVTYRIYIATPYQNIADDTKNLIIISENKYYAMKQFVSSEAFMDAGLVKLDNQFEFITRQKLYEKLFHTNDLANVQKELEPFFKIETMEFDQHRVCTHHIDLLD